METVNYIEVGSNELQRCPAAIDMNSGVISINSDVWNKYNEFQQSFIIAHELGHFNLQTDSETEADKYALSQVYGTCEKSLKKSLGTLYRIGYIDSSRLWKLYEECLKIDSKAGNQSAAIELQNITEINKNQPKKENNMNYIAKRRNRADGDTTTTTTTTTATETKNNKKTHNTNGLSVGSVYFSFTNILLIIIAILIFVVVRKIN